MGGNQSNKKSRLGFSFLVKTGLSLDIKRLSMILK